MRSTIKTVSQIAVMIVLSSACEDRQQDFRNPDSFFQENENSEDAVVEPETPTDTPSLISIVSNECGINLENVSLQGSVDLPLFNVESKPPVAAAGDIKELVDLIIEEPTLAGFADFILNVTRFVTGIQNYSADATAEVAIDSNLTGTTIAFQGIIDKLNIDLIENSDALTEVVTDLGNSLAQEVLSRSVHYQYLPFGERIKGDFGYEITRTVCTLQYSDKVDIAGQTNSVLTFDPPLPCY